MLKQSLLRYWMTVSISLLNLAIFNGQVNPLYAAEPQAPASSGNPDTTVNPLPFRDIPPDSWAFQAILSLYSHYGCLVGYPDGTFRGNEPVSRYEFAAGLSACLDILNSSIEQQTLQQGDDLIHSLQESLDQLRELPSQ